MIHKGTASFLFLAVILPFLANPASAQDKVRRAELTPEAKKAIEKGLAHIAKGQNSDGSWGTANQIAITSLCLTAYMVKGEFPDRGPHGEMLAKGVAYLLNSSRVSKSGYLGDSMYAHGLATLALSEVWGETSRSEEVREALKKAVAVIVKGQVAKGGWDYQPTSTTNQCDVSITVMQVVALASAKEAGILVPDETIKNAIKFVKSCQHSNGGIGYKDRGGRGGLATTAAGVVSLMLAGERSSDEVKRGIQYLQRLGDTAFRNSTYYHYGHYYAVQAMYQSGERDFQEWYPKIRDDLIKTQQSHGGWREGIRDAQNAYCTPMAILILGVPHRFLPIFQR